MDSTHPLIQAEDLYRYYGKDCAVKGVSVTLNKGEILGFLGPNGAGKSTTMQMICGNLAPSSGRIRIDGMDLLERPRDAKRLLGYLPENPPLYRELTVDEFLGYCARLHGIRGGDMRKAVQHAKEHCGLEDVGKRLIGNLSKGFQQRTGIAQAIVHSPAAIVLDEPTVGLDPIQVRQIRRLIRDLGEDRGIILSTHILPEVQESCTRVQIIHQGRAVLNDSVAGVLQQMRACSLILATRSAANQATLAVIDGVHEVEDLGENRYRLLFRSDSDPAEQVAETVVKMGWGLLELSPERRSMEEIFVEITATDAHGEERAA